jgi:nicotinamidase-related amidase
MVTQSLLLMDLQGSVLARFPDHKSELLSVLSGAAAAARAAGIPVIHVRIAFRDGTPEISRHNRVFAAHAGASTLLEGAGATAIDPALGPEPGDIVVTKKRVSAFSGSDLQLILRSLEVRSLVLAGIATSGVVLSTVREAADLDYELTVLRDGCVDADPEVHRVLLDKVFPRQASVISTAEWISTNRAT